MEKIELTRVEKTKLQLYAMIEVEAVLKRQILLRDIKLRLGLSAEDQIALRGSEVFIEKVEEPCNLKEAPGNSMS